MKVEKDYSLLLDTIVTEFVQLLPKITKASVPSITDLPPFKPYILSLLPSAAFSIHLQYQTKYKYQYINPFFRHQKNLQENSNLSHINH